MKVSLKLLAILVCTMAFTAMMVPRASAAVGSGFIPVTPQNVVDSTGNVVGQITAVDITSVTSTGTKLVASGAALVQTATGGTSIAQFTNAPLDPSGSCPILHLSIGPINLNLLGLQVTTNKIVIDITAQPGPGNLLGNLLCDVANLLNQNPLNLNQIAVLLNQILASL